MNIISNYNYISIKEVYKIKPVEKTEKEEDIVKKPSFSFYKGKLIDTVV